MRPNGHRLRIIMRTIKGAATYSRDKLTALQINEKRQNYRTRCGAVAANKMA
ncbi:unnamed protein product, partial [Amoebophrya sp. A25]|eukprot:GSA25T00011456001.1